MKAHIIETIRSGGPIDFAQYMQMALYTDEIGYYQNEHCPLGARGDFTTAPEIGPWLAFSLAISWQLLLSELHDGVVLELGPGTGRLAIDFLRACEQLDVVPRQYVLVERNPFWAAAQQKSLKDALPSHLYKVCQWVSAPPKVPWQGLLLANEVLDAQPVHIFVQGKASFCIGSSIKTNS